MSATLFVPIRLDALAVNDAVSKTLFRRWAFNYAALPRFVSPMPEPGQDDMPGPSDDVSIAKGVYLHWTLPRALRTQPKGKPYRAVPNRWLVVRTSGGAPRPSSAWVVESDCPSSPDQGGVPYLLDPDVLAAWARSADPERRTSGKVGVEPSHPGDVIHLLGRRWELQRWAERTGPDEPLFLTATAPANPVFSAYVPHNNNVFSFWDDLSDAPEGLLSYSVVGWYSNPAADVLAPGGGGAKTMEDLLADLRWARQGDPAEVAGRSVYGGTVFALDPDPAPTAPDPLAIAESGVGLEVAVGNSTVDAFTTLLSATAGLPAAATTLFRALQCDALALLNRPGGEAALEETARRGWFSAKPGGTRWTIAADTKASAAADGTTGSKRRGDITLSPEEKDLLRRVRADQLAQDRAVAQLFALQRDVVGRWTQFGYYDYFMQPDIPDGFDATTFPAFQSRLKADLDSATPAGSAARLIRAFDAVIDGAERLPAPVTGADDARAAYAGGLQAFTAKTSLPGAGKVLKPIAAEPYHVVGDPVVVISGVEPAAATFPEDGLAVRFQGQLVDRVSVGGTVVTATAIARVATLPAMSSLPDGVGALLAEAALLDPLNTEALSSEAAVPVEGAGVPPAYGLKRWTQPWEPMFMEWEVGHVPFPDAHEGQPCWAFDGTDYVLTAAGASAVEIPKDGSDPPQSHRVGGTSLLGPQAQEIFERRVRDFATSFGSDEGLQETIEKVFGWKFVAQQLSGFGTLLSGYDARPFRRPSPADELGTGVPPGRFADLTGFGGAGSPLPADLRGEVSSVPRLVPEKLPFTGLRQGLAFFRSLTLYDKFGRALKVIGSSGGDDYANFPFEIDRALGGPAARWMYLPPRLMQGARLDFDLIDAVHDDRQVDVDDTANPVCGFILPNHLDRSISLYDPRGGPLGEFRLTTADDGSSSGRWSPLPGGVSTFEQVQAAAPRLAAMLDPSSGIATERGFSGFLAAIDSTLWTVDPLGDRVDQNLSVLIGRPLALIRARLAVTLDGPPLADPGFVVTDQALQGLGEPPPFLARRLPIRVGDRAARHDGVIGYFEGDDHGTFNAVTMPDPGTETPYIRPIGPPGDLDGNYVTVTCEPDVSAVLTILADPRADLHAATGLLPLRRITIPSRFVERPLQSLAVGFRLGPSLTDLKEEPLQDVKGPSMSKAVTMPLPAEQRGTWAWWELEAGKGWVGRAVLNAMGQARLGPVPNSLREGVLQLSITLDAERTKDATDHDG